METFLFYTQFSPLNAGNCLLGLYNLKMFWARMPPDTPWNSQLLYSNLLATSIFIETTVYVFSILQILQNEIFVLYLLSC